MSTATTAWEWVESASLASGGASDPVITPDHFSDSASKPSTRSASVGSSVFAGTANESDGSQDGGDSSNAIANSMARSSNAERAVREVEVRVPGAHRQLAVDVAFDARFELPAGIRRLPVRKPERGIFQHGAQAGIRLRDLERGLRRRPLGEARAGNGHIAAR